MQRVREIMAIRNSAKALIVSEDKNFVNRCVTQKGEACYDLPGGGQHLQETMEEAVVREVLEETGYQVRVVRFAALAVEINACLEGGKYSEYAHRIISIFQVEFHSLSAVNRRSIWDVYTVKNGIYKNIPALVAKMMQS